MLGLKLSLRAVQAMAGMVCAALLLIQWQSGPINVIVALLLFPIFLVSVSVVSWLCGEGMYFWDKSRGTFVRYDSETHPVRAFVWFALLAAGDACLIAFFFKLQSGAT